MSRNATGLLAFGIVGGLFLLVGGGVVALVVAGGRDKGAGNTSGPGLFVSKPRADREGSDWTMGELLAHLKASGVVLNQAYGSPDQIPDGISYLCQTEDGDLAHIWQYKDIRMAKDLAGANGDIAFGRFRLSIPPKRKDQVRKALGT